MPRSVPIDEILDKTIVKSYSFEDLFYKPSELLASVVPPKKAPELFNEGIVPIVASEGGRTHIIFAAPPRVRFYPHPVVIRAYPEKNTLRRVLLSLGLVSERIPEDEEEEIVSEIPDVGEASEEDFFDGRKLSKLGEEFRRIFISFVLSRANYAPPSDLEYGRTFRQATLIRDGRGEPLVRIVYIKPGERRKFGVLVTVASLEERRLNEGDAIRGELIYGKAAELADEDPESIVGMTFTDDRFRDVRVSELRTKEKVRVLARLSRDPIRKYYFPKLVAARRTDYVYTVEPLNTYKGLVSGKGKEYERVMMIPEEPVTIPASLLHELVSQG